MFSLFPSLPAQRSAPHRALQCSTASHSCTLTSRDGPLQGPHSPVWISFGTQERISECQVYSADRKAFQGGLHCVLPQTWTAHEGFFAVKSPIPSSFTVRRNPGTRQHLSQLLFPRLLPQASGRKQSCFKAQYTPLTPKGLLRVTTLPLHPTRTWHAVAAPNQPLPVS